MKPISLAVLFLAFSCGTARQQPSGMTSPLDKQGHRGCRGLLPENTIPAMLKAIDLGVTTLEMDVHVSANNQVVVAHDPRLSEEITTGPGGRALTEEERKLGWLYRLPYDSIRRYDVGLKPHPRFPQQQKMAVQMPLLSDLINAAERHAADKGRLMRYNIEIKSTATGDGTAHPPVADFVALVMAVVNKAGIGGRTTIQSFDPRALQVLHRQFPQTASALLIEDDDHRDLDEQLAQLGFVPTTYSPHFSLVNEAVAKRCREKGMKLVPWTVNDLVEMRRLLALGVDGIITDYPDLFARL